MPTVLQQPLGLNTTRMARRLSRIQPRKFPKDSARAPFKRLFPAFREARNITSALAVLTPKVKTAARFLISQLLLLAAVAEAAVAAVAAVALFLPQRLIRQTAS